MFEFEYATRTGVGGNEAAVRDGDTMRVTGEIAQDLLGVVSAFAPVDRRRFGHPASRSGRLQDAERYRGSAHVLPTPRCRGNRLGQGGPAAQEVSQLVVAAAIPPRRSSALQSKHRSTSALDAAVILLKSVVQIATCPMPHMAPSSVRIARG